jgi:hypothetical protein
MRPIAEEALDGTLARSMTAGFDRFGRVIRQAWVDGKTDTALHA